jgi:hypothetical protein
LTLFSVGWQPNTREVKPDECGKTRIPTTTTTPIPDVTLPAWAVQGEWQDVGTSGAFRYFEGSRWVVDRREDLCLPPGDVEVYIRGTQDLTAWSNARL